VFNVVQGDSETVDCLLDHPAIQAVSFVGSTPVAEHIYRRGTMAGKRVQALGGAKNHMVVLPDADLDQAVDALLGAAYGSAGERCMAISVAIAVGDRLGDCFVEALAPRVKALRMGPGDAPGVEMGPLVTGAHLSRVKSYPSPSKREPALSWTAAMLLSPKTVKASFSEVPCLIMSDLKCAFTGKRFSVRFSAWCVSMTFGRQSNW
jgi:malonate-semialdehyde dehydrogenase (acetylating)/methylmalonate-semialdehyde dehydrogenase